jgi:hypothetical protein
VSGPRGGLATGGGACPAAALGGGMLARRSRAARSDGTDGTADARGATAPAPRAAAVAPAARMDP